MATITATPHPNHAFGVGKTHSSSLPGTQGKDDDNFHIVCLLGEEAEEGKNESVSISTTK